MKHVFISTLAAAVLFSVPALATGKHDPKPQPKPPVHNYSPHFTGKQYQLQGQAQSSRNVNRNSVSNVNNVATHSTASSASSASSRSVNAGNHQTMSYHESRQRLQAPALAASFSSVQGSPCEGVPFGLGGSAPGFGGLLQIPRESGNCWAERKAILVKQLGGSSAAAIAVLGGHDPITAVNSYGYEQRYYAPRRAKRAKRARCAC